MVSVRPCARSVLHLFPCTKCSFQPAIIIPFFHSSILPSFHGMVAKPIRRLHEAYEIIRSLSVVDNDLDKDLDKDLETHPEGCML